MSAPEDGALSARIPELFDELYHRVRAGQRLFSLTTRNVNGVLATLREYARENNRRVVQWDAADGWRESVVGRDGRREGIAKEEIARVAKVLNTDPEIRANPQHVLKAIVHFHEPDAGLFVVHNFHTFLEGSAASRQLLANFEYDERLVGQAQGSSPPISIDRAVVFLSTEGAKFHPEVAELLFPLEVPRPDEARIRGGPVEGLARYVAAQGKPVEDPALLDNLAKTCLGLDQLDIERCLGLSVSRHKGITPAALAEVRREKAKALRRSRVLNPLDDAQMADPADVCGMDALLADIRLAAGSYTDEAMTQGMDMPRGIVLAGLPGTGKSMLASATAHVFREAVGREFPLVKVDVGAIFAKHLGESEQNWREARQALEAQRHSGVVAFWDEAGRALSGMGGQGADDGGGQTAQRIFGDILSWTEEMFKQGARIYPVFTMNAIGALPAEFFSRIDDLYFLDLPEADVRLEIFRTHISRRLRHKGRGLSLDDLCWDDGDWEQLAKASENFVGREIEQAIVLAERQAFAGGVRPVKPDLEVLLEILADRRKHTIAVTQSGKLEQIRNSCSNGRKVRTPPPAAPARANGRRGGQRKIALD